MNTIGPSARLAPPLITRPRPVPLATHISWMTLSLGREAGMTLSMIKKPWHSHSIPVWHNPPHPHPHPHPLPLSILSSHTSLSQMLSPPLFLAHAAVPGAARIEFTILCNCLPKRGCCCCCCCTFDSRNKYHCINLGASCSVEALWTLFFPPLSPPLHLHSPWNWPEHPWCLLLKSKDRGDKDAHVFPLHMSFQSDANA